MRIVKSLFFASTFLASTLTAAKADVNVVTSLKPIHSLVSAVMEGVGEPTLIVEGAGSPHAYALKPSQAQSLESADVVFWVGDELEAFLEKPLQTIAANAKSVALIDAHDLIKLKFRDGGAFDDHGHEEKGHDDHGHEKKAKADHDDHGHDDHGHEKKAKAGHDDHGHDDHGHEGFDPHIWLDPINAKALVHEIEEVLSEKDPTHAAQYEANAKALESKLDRLVADVSTELKPLHDKGFIVFHDAYQYFEKRFDIKASGSITISPEILPGAERVSEIQGKIKQLGVTCVFAEPQFEPKLVSTVIEGTKAKSGVIDPLGAALEKGPDQYFQLIRNMATSIKKCLTELT